MPFQSKSQTVGELLQLGLDAEIEDKADSAGLAHLLLSLDSSMTVGQLLDRMEKAREAGRREIWGRCAKRAGNIETVAARGDEARNGRGARRKSSGSGPRHVQSESAQELRRCSRPAARRESRAA
jgi:hypothetical protein